jgi:hypothetical protein
MVTVDRFSLLLTNLCNNWYTVDMDIIQPTQDSKKDRYLGIKVNLNFRKLIPKNSIFNFIESVKWYYGLTILSI